MSRRLSKVSLLFLALVLALSGVGAAFAAWTDSVTISGAVTTSSLCWEIAAGSGGSVHGSGPDWNCFFDLKIPREVFEDPEGKDVADTIVTEIDSHTLAVLVDNAYPYYYDHVAFLVHDCGDVPLKFWRVVYKFDDTVVEQYIWGEYHYLDLDGDGEPDVEIYWGDPMGTQMHYCQTIDFSFELLVLQPAPQSQTLEFELEIWAIQWNEYEPGPVEGACEKF